MKKYLPAYLLIITCILNAFILLQAQNITIVPNPTAQPGIFAWNGSGAYSGYSGSPIIYNNTLVAEYNASGYSSPTFPLIQNLAVYNGSSMQVIANPDAGKGVLLQSGKIIFDSKLFFIYMDAPGVQRLASFDGTSITLYPNPDASASGVIGSFRILNNNLYLAYQNASVVTQLARFNGSGITPIANPDAAANGYFNNFSVVFNNKIVSRYITAAGPKKLATYDGTQWTILPNPDNTPNRGVQPIFPVLYKNKLYFSYFSVTSQYQYLEYDGINNPTLIANPQNSATNTGGVWGLPIVFNDTLFFQYKDISNVNRLAKFGGSSITLVPSPDASPNGYWNTPILNNNKLYFLYLPADNRGRMGEYQSASGSILVYPNPDAGTGFWDKPIVYDSKIYFQYMNPQNILQLAFFDGSSTQLISNPAGNFTADYPNSGYTANPIVWNNKLYMQFASVPYRYAGNLAYFAGSSAICPGSNTSFLSELSGSSYQWQVDIGSGSFTNLSNAAPYSTVTTNTLNLTAPATALYGYKYRCVVNGNMFSQTFTLKFASNWTGAVSTAWETAGNWSCGAIPDANTDVYINVGQPRYPLVNSTRSVRSVLIQNGTTLEIAANQNLTVTGK